MKEIKACGEQEHTIKDEEEFLETSDLSPLVEVVDMRIKCTKIMYFSEEGANKAMDKIKARHKKSKCMRRLKPKRSYHCPNCNFWHLTSQNAK